MIHAAVRYVNYIKPSTVESAGDRPGQESTLTKPPHHTYHRRELPDHGRRFLLYPSFIPIAARGRFPSFLARFPGTGGLPFCALLVLTLLAACGGGSDD